MTALPLLPGLAGRQLARVTAGIGQAAPGILEARRRAGQIAVDLDPAARRVQRLAEPVERRPGAGGITLGEARRRVLQRLPRGPVRLAGLTLERRQIAGERLLLVAGHRVETIREILEIGLRLLRVATRVRLRIAGRRS